MSTDYAFCVPNVDRPTYTKQICDTIETWVDIDTVDWYFLQAGSSKHLGPENQWDPELVSESRNYIETADIPNLTLIDDDPHKGLLMARDEFFSLFDAGYDAVVWFENDMLSSKYTVPLYKQLLDLFPEAVVSLYRHRNYDVVGGEDRLDEFVVADDCHWFTLGITEQTFRTIEDDWELMKQILVDHLFEWPGTVERVAPRLFGENTPRVASDSGPKPGHPRDATFSRVCRKNDVPRIYPSVSRARNVGATGQSMDEQFYENDPHLGNEGPMTFDQDAGGVQWEYGGSRLIFESTPLDVDLDYYRTGLWE